MRIGVAHVSTRDQQPEAQQDALAAAWFLDPRVPAGMALAATLAIRYLARRRSDLKDRRPT